MMKSRIGPLVVLGVGLAVLAGCAPRHLMQDVPDYQVKSAPAAGQAVVVFLRPTIVNQRQSISLFDTTRRELKFVGLLPADRKIAYAVEPGSRRFMMVPTGGRADFIEGTFAPGKTYYVRIAAEGGVPHLFPQSIRKADLDSAKLAKDLGATTWVVNSPRSENWAMRKMRTMERKASIFETWLIKYKRPPLRPEDGK